MSCLHVLRSFNCFYFDFQFVFIFSLTLFCSLLFLFLFLVYAFLCGSVHNFNSLSLSAANQTKAVSSVSVVAAIATSVGKCLSFQYYIFSVYLFNCKKCLTYFWLLLSFYCYRPTLLILFIGFKHILQCWKALNLAISLFI